MSRETLGKVLLGLVAAFLIVTIHTTFALISKWPWAEASCAVSVVLGIAAFALAELMGQDTDRMMRRRRR